MKKNGEKKFFIHTIIRVILDKRLIHMLMLMNSISFSTTFEQQDNWVSSGWGPVPAVMIKFWFNYSIKLKD